jgi:flavin-dependent dehydrogenase
VLGGGPAGCSAARLLARWGHEVLLVTRPPDRAAAALAESLTPSCAKFFDLLGVGDAIEAAGFVRSTGNTVWWGTDETRVEPFAGGARGWQVTTSGLEQVLIDAAIGSGVRIERRTATAEDVGSNGAPWLLDCTGRSGLVARPRGGRRYEPGHRTVSLTAVWESQPAWPLADPSHTLIESYEDGWAWSVPIDLTRRAVAVMVDPRTTAIARGDGARAAYLGEIAKTRRLSGLLAGRSMTGGPDGWDASMYSSATYTGPGWLLVGDAASFVDPLSSAGVRKALASGWLAAVTVHTALVRPAMADTALGFYAAREAEMYASFLSLTRRFLSQAAGGQSHPFWADRLEGEDAGPEAGRVDELAVRAAHDRIRQAPELRVRLGRDTRIEPRPAIGGAEIVVERRLVTADMPAGVRFLHDVDLVTLVEIAPAHRQVPDLYEACVRQGGPIDLAAFLRALATAVARGWLEWEV